MKKSIDSAGRISYLCRRGFMGFSSQKQGPQANIFVFFTVRKSFSYLITGGIHETV
jgi:hypothetical protein